MPEFPDPSSPPPPPLIYGTAWKKERTASLVEQALVLGFEGIDTACQPKHYDEPAVGTGMQAAFARGVERSRVYIQTKFTSLAGQDPKRVPYDASAPIDVQVEQSCAASLRNLRVDRLDCLVLHSPYNAFDDTFTAWRAMERLVQRGYVAQLGLSNCYDQPSFERLWATAAVKPVVLQNRFYRETSYDEELRRFCQAHGVQYQSFWTLTANPHLLSSNVVQAIATRYGVTSAQAFFRCLTQLHITPLTGTSSERHMREDLAIFSFELDAGEVSKLTALLRQG